MYHKTKMEKTVTKKLFTTLILVTLLISAFSMLYELPSVFANTSSNGYIIFKNGFEGGATGGFVYLYLTGASMGVNSSYAYTGSYGLDVNGSSSAGGSSRLGQLLYGSYSTLSLQSRVKFVSGGTSSSGDNEGVKLLGLSDTGSGPQVSALVYNNSGTLCFGVRRYSSSTWVTNYNASSVCTAGNWNLVEIRANSTSYTLYVNGTKTYEESSLSLPSSYAGIFVGNTYGAAGANRVAYDDVVIGTDYIGTGDSVASTYYTDGGMQYLYSNSTYIMQYPSVFNGALYVVKSKAGTTIGAIVEKRNSTTLALIATASLNNSETESFSAQEYNGLLYIPSISYSGSTYGTMAILNATTLAYVANVTFATAVSTALLQVCIDNVNGYLYVGDDPQIYSYGFYKCRLNETTVAANYQYVNVSSSIHQGSESQIVMFNNTIYVLVTSPGSGAAGSEVTKLYHSSTPTNGSFTLDWTKNATNTASGAYFSHLTASSQYLVAGIMSNETTGVSTYRYQILNTTSSTFTEIDSRVAETTGEDHPTANALGNDTFLLENCVRQIGGGIKMHTISVLNATSSEVTYLTTPGTYYNSTSYNDRWVGIDQVNSKIYFGCSYDYTPTTASAVGFITRMNWSLPLSTPAYESENITYQIVASNDSYSTISPSGDVSATYLGNQNFTYSANSGYYISQVLVDSSPVSITGFYYFSSIIANHTIAVSATANTYQIVASNDSHCTISPSGTVASSYLGNQNFTYSASGGYVIDQVLVDGSPVGITGFYYFSGITSNRTISVTSSASSYVIIATNDGHCTTTPSGSIGVSYGGSQNITYSANSGYFISHVYVDSSPVSITGYYYFSGVVANHTFSVEASPNSYVVVTSSDANSIVNPTGTVSLGYLGSQNFTYAILTPGYIISSVLVDSSPVTITGFYYFSSVSANHTLSVEATFSFTPSPTPIPTASPNPSLPTPTPYPTYDPTNRPIQILDLYFRPDTYETCGISAYGLDTDYTNEQMEFITNQVGLRNVTYGYKVFLVTSPTNYLAISGDTPVAQVSLTGNFSGTLSSTWICSTTDIVLGYQAIKVDLYVSTDNTASWTAQGAFISNVLITNKIAASSWTFVMDVTFVHTNDTQSTLYFGNTDHRSGINGISIEQPLEAEIQNFRLSHADLMGFFVGGYFDIFGDALYILILFGVCASLYRRYNHFGIVAVFFAMFSGSGGILLLFLPIWALPVIAGFLIIGCGFILWRVIR